MTRTKQWMLPLGAAGLVLLGLATPKAAHAVVAALVQITNTAANPAITQDVGQQASQQVTLFCVGVPVNNNGYCELIPPNGQANSVGYTVPANQSLVITSAYITPMSFGGGFCPSLATAYIEPNNVAGSSIQTWYLGANATGHFTYPSGIAVTPGTGVTVEGGTSAGSGCQIFAWFHGYLTVN